MAFQASRGKQYYFGSDMSFLFFLLCPPLCQVTELVSSLSSSCCSQITKVPENLLPFAVQCRNLTVSNTRTVLLTPEIYVDQNIHEQLVDLMLEAILGGREYISKICELLHLISKFYIPVIALESCRSNMILPKLRTRTHLDLWG